MEIPVRVERIGPARLAVLEEEVAALRRRCRSLEVACRVAGEELRAERARTRQALALCGWEAERCGA